MPTPTVTNQRIVPEIRIMAFLVGALTKAPQADTHRKPDASAVRMRISSDSAVDFGSSGVAKLPVFKDGPSRRGYGPENAAVLESKMTVPLPAVALATST
jgi:hypothetical protein